MKKFLCFLMAALCISFEATAFAANEEELPVNPPAFVLADTEDVYAVINAFMYEESSDEYVAEIYFENRSDSSVEFGAENIGVQGFIVDSYCYNVLAAGRKSISYLEILAEPLRYLGIEQPEEISFVFYVNDTSGEEYRSLFRDKLFYYPTGKSADQIRRIEVSDFGSYDYAIDNDFLKYREIDAKWTENGEFYELDFVLENQCAFDFVVQCASFAVNGSPVDAYSFCVVPAGMKAMNSIWFPKEALQETEITDPEWVSYTLLLYENTEAFRTGEVAIPFFAYPVNFSLSKG